jgi:hypothetical protein
MIDKLHTMSLITRDMQNLYKLLAYVDFAELRSVEKDIVELLATKQRVQYIIKTRIGDNNGIQS